MDHPNGSKYDPMLLAKGDLTHTEEEAPRRRQRLMAYGNKSRSVSCWKKQGIHVPESLWREFSLQTSIWRHGF
jgi:hypothetical protein